MGPRIRAAVAVGLGGLIALALWFLAPGSQPTPVPAPLPVPVPMVAAAPSPAPSAQPPRPPSPPPRAPAQPLVPPRVAPRPPVDPDIVHKAELNGIAEALFTRHPRLLDCYQSHVEAFGPVRGRPTIRATVFPNDDGEGELEIQIENEGIEVGELDDCFADAMADARFAPPEVPTTIMHPLPVPSLLP